MLIFYKSTITLTRIQQHILALINIFHNNQSIQISLYFIYQQYWTNTLTSINSSHFDQSESRSNCTVLHFWSALFWSTWECNPHPITEQWKLHGMVAVAIQGWGIIWTELLIFEWRKKNVSTFFNAEELYV